MQTAVIFPLMAQGQTIPLLDIENSLLKPWPKSHICHHPIKCTIHFFHPNISLSIIPFPKVQDLPQGCENTADVPSMAPLVLFIEATKKMKQPFEDVLRDMIDDGCPPICVISDFFPVSKSTSLNVPSVKKVSPLDPIELSELKIPFTLNIGDIPDVLLNGDQNEPSVRLLMELEEADVNSWGVIVNSFEEIEGDYVGAFESNYCNEAKAYCVGPLLLYDELDQELDAQWEKEKTKAFLDALVISGDQLISNSEGISECHLLFEPNSACSENPLLKNIVMKSLVFSSSLPN